MGVDVVQAEESSYCDDCPLKDKPYVVGYGYSWAPFFVVGTAPGQYESMSGVAFTGEHGLLVRDLLEDMGVNMEDLYFTNVLKRRPVAEEGGNRKPTDKECWKCGSHLVREMVRSQPRLVLSLGATPLKFLTSSRHRLDTMRGLPVPIRRSGVRFKVLPTYDPSYVARRGGLVSTEGDGFIHDLQEFVRLIRSGRYDD